MSLTEHERKDALGRWGEIKAITLLRRANFTNVRDLNEPTPHHPFGDVLAERDGNRYLIGVKTRNKFKVHGLLNTEYNMRKKGADVAALAEQYEAQPAWVTIQVVPELGIFWAYYGTDLTKRLWISMRERDTEKYTCLADQEADATILVEWSNGGYARSR